MVVCESLDVAGTGGRGGQNYRFFPEEEQYKDLHKNRRNLNWRSYKEMKKDINKQHKYFNNPVISSTDDDEQIDDQQDIDIDIHDNY